MSLSVLFTCRTLVASFPWDPGGIPSLSNRRVFLRKRKDFGNRTERRSVQHGIRIPHPKIQDLICKWIRSILCGSCWGYARLQGRGGQKRDFLRGGRIKVLPLIGQNEPMCRREGECTSLPRNPVSCRGWTQYRSHARCSSSARTASPTFPAFPPRSIPSLPSSAEDL